MTFSGRFLINIMQFAAQQGADLKQLVAISGLPMEQLATEDLRVDAEIYRQVLIAALTATRDPLLGLHMGEHMNLTAAGLIYQIVQTSATVEDALRYCCDFANLGCRALPLSLRRSPTELIIELQADPLWMLTSPQVAHQTMDGTMAFMIRQFQGLTLNRCLPSSVQLPHGSRQHRSEYERVFRCAVTFGGTYAAIHLKLDHTKQTIITHDYALLRVLIQHAEQKLAELATQTGFPTIVKRSIMNMAGSTFPSAEEVAANLNLSVRSMQRKLFPLNTSFQALLEEVRCDLAHSYLKRPDLGIGDIAYLLGYSQPSAFVRSFKRWTGSTPTQVRSAK